MHLVCFREPPTALLPLSLTNLIQLGNMREKQISLTAAEAKLNIKHQDPFTMSSPEYSENLSVPETGSTDQPQLNSILS